MTARQDGGTAGLPERSATARLNIPVSGMTCAACQARVQRVLERTPGVDDAAVSLMTNTATVRFDPGIVDVNALVERIRGTGYGAELPADERSAVEEQVLQYQIFRLTNCYIIQNEAFIYQTRISNAHSSVQPPLGPSPNKSLQPI
jgi:copper chaperone CopZ